LLGPQGANKQSVNEATQDVPANMMSTYRDNSISRLTAYWVEIKIGLKGYPLYVEFASVKGEQARPCLLKLNVGPTHTCRTTVVSPLLPRNTVPRSCEMVMDICGGYATDPICSSWAEDARHHIRDSKLPILSLCRRLLFLYLSSQGSTEGRSNTPLLLSALSHPFRPPECS
jgi:hypothetical protein